MNVGGKTLAQIAAEKDWTVEQFSALMMDARSQAADQTVKDGMLTQEQADWLKTRRAHMNVGAAGMHGGRDRRGSYVGNQDCQHFPQTTPYCNNEEIKHDFALNYQKIGAGWKSCHR